MTNKQNYNSYLRALSILLLNCKFVKCFSLIPHIILLSEYKLCANTQLQKYKFCAKIFKYTIA